MMSIVWLICMIYLPGAETFANTNTICICFGEGKNLKFLSKFQLIVIFQHYLATYLWSNMKVRWSWAQYKLNVSVLSSCYSPANVAKIDYCMFKWSWSQWRRKYPALSLKRTRMDSIRDEDIGGVFREPSQAVNDTLLSSVTWQYLPVPAEINFPH